MKLALVPVLFGLLVKIGNVASRQSANVRYYGLVPCREPVESESTVECTQDEATKLYNIHMVVQEDIDAGEQEYYTLIHEWEEKRNDWNYDAYEVDGPLDEGIKDYVSDAWDKLIPASNPPIDDKNFIPAGTYDMTNLTFMSQDVSVPTGLEGHYKLDFYLLDDEGEGWFCTGIEFEISFK